VVVDLVRRREVERAPRNQPTEQRSNCSQLIYFSRYETRPE
jgi:hypothetical protein